MTYTGGSTPITFNTFCIDLFHDVSVGQTYAVNVRNDLDAAFANGSRMAYVFENFGLPDLTNDPDTAAAVQIALWDLSLNNHNPTSFGLDADGTWSSGDESIFAVDLGGNPDAAHIAALVDSYLQASVGATTAAGWLDAAAAGDALNRGQSLLIPQPQFGNQPTVSGVTFNPTAGLLTSSISASITEADPSVQASDFHVSIDWGDGSAVDTSATIIANGQGGFDIQGTHTFALQGAYTVTVTVDLGSSESTATGTAVVQDTPLTAQPIAPVFTVAPGLPLATGQTPDSVATGDFNGDGNSDLLVANYNGNSVGVYFSDGQGGFTPEGVYQTGNGPNGFAVAPDSSFFAIGNYIDGTVSVFLNQGDGTFALSQTLTAGPGTANRMALVDVNSDGNLDLVTANQNDNSVSVFLGNGDDIFEGDISELGTNPVAGIGDGTFENGTNYVAGNGPIAVVAGDFNGDGRVDLVTANSNDSTLTLLPGNGDGTFGAPVVVGQALGNPFDLVAADFNGDGNVDLASASLFGQVTVFLGHGDGTFDPTIYNTGSNPTQLTVDDFNGDGNLDLAVSNYGSNTVGILSGNGDGTFQPVLSLPVSGGLNGIISGDFNNDGTPDLAVVGQDNNTAQVLLNQTLTAAEAQPFSGVIASFTSADANATVARFSATIDWGDGQTSQVGPEAFSVNANGGFNLTAGHTYEEGGDYSINVTILDQGGSTTSASNFVHVSDPPLSTVGTTVQAEEGQSFNGVIASLTDADPNATTEEYSATIDWDDGTITEVGPEAFSVNDSGGFDLTANHTYDEAGNYSVTVMIFDEGGSQTIAITTAVIADAPLTTLPPPPMFVPATGSPLGAGNTPDSAGTLTLDNGQQVLLVANFIDSTVSVLESNGDGTFTSLGTLSTENGPNGFAVGDFNGDGHQDFAVANYYSGTVTVYLGDGTDNFTAAPDLATGNGPANEMAVGDFNGDGKLDLATANQNDGTVSVFFGNGDTMDPFAAAVTYSVGVGIDAIVAGDFRGNGQHRPGGRELQRQHRDHPPEPGERNLHDGEPDRRRCQPLLHHRRGFQRRREG